LHIWVFQISEPIPIEDGATKLRTSFLVDELIARNHTVIWWASAFNHLKKHWYFQRDSEVHVGKNLVIKALRGIGYARNLSLMRLLDHRILSWKFSFYSKFMPPPDIIICSLPSYDLAYRATKYAKKNHIPIVIDIRDKWPDNFVDVLPRNCQGLAKKILYFEFKMLETVLQNADSLLSMVSGLLDWGLERGSRKKSQQDRVFFLGYKRSDEKVNGSIDKVTNILPQLKNKLVITFIGTFAAYHNPKILVECAQRLRDLGACIVLAGDGPHREILMESAKGMDIIFPGWLNQAEATLLLKNSDIGICPTARLGDQVFFPNKAFAYFSEGLPILTSFKGDLEDLIKKYSLGGCYKDQEELISLITFLSKNPEALLLMKNNVKKVFDELFDASRIYSDYADHIEKVARNFSK
jgi:glycosyltransferase involved in cell wall biosynthesis